MQHEVDSVKTHRDHLTRKYLYDFFFSAHIFCQQGNATRLCSALFWQELVKHTHDAAERSNLKIALDAMKVSRGE